MIILLLLFLLLFLGSSMLPQQLPTAKHIWCSMIRSAFLAPSFISSPNPLGSCFHINSPHFRVFISYDFPLLIRFLYFIDIDHSFHSEGNCFLKTGQRCLIYDCPETFFYLFLQCVCPQALGHKLGVNLWTGDNNEKFRSNLWSL